LVGITILLKIHQSQTNIYTLFLRFDLITRSSSEEAGTQFFRVLMRRSAVASRKRAYTRSQRIASLTEYSKSPLTDHANEANHTIDWKKDYGHRQRTRPSYQVDQGSCTYPQGYVQLAVVRDKGSYQLSHAYDRFLDATADRHIKTRKN